MKSFIAIAIVMAAIYTENHQETEVNLKTGDTFTVKLKSNLSTGYSWMFDGDKSVEQVGKSTFDNPQKDVSGAPEMQVMVFRVKNPGNVNFVLHYAKSWERKATDKKYKLLLKVK